VCVFVCVCGRPRWCNNRNDDEEARVLGPSRCSRSRRKNHTANDTHRRTVLTLVRDSLNFTVGCRSFRFDRRRPSFCVYMCMCESFQNTEDETTQKEKQLVRRNLQRDTERKREREREREGRISAERNRSKLSGDAVRRPRLRPIQKEEAQERCRRSPAESGIWNRDPLSFSVGRPYRYRESPASRSASEHLSLARYNSAEKV